MPLEYFSTFFMLAISVAGGILLANGVEFVFGRLFLL